MPGKSQKRSIKIASGGELSRIVLALKNVLTRIGSVDTVVFDEVDSGIGGATAEIVGRKLKTLSAHHQVICITHLPQIASFGGPHPGVSKKVAGGRTSTVVEKSMTSRKSRKSAGCWAAWMRTETARIMPGNCWPPSVTGRSRNAKKSAHR